MFEPPDNVLPEEERYDITVKGAILFRVEVHPDMTVIVMAATEEEDGTVSLFRFPVKPHQRAVRKWFRSVGIRDTPIPPWGGTVKQGVFLIDIQGTCIGTDNLPEEVPEDVKHPPKAMYVLSDVKLRDYLP